MVCSWNSWRPSANELDLGCQWLVRLGMLLCFQKNKKIKRSTVLAPFITFLQLTLGYSGCYIFPPPLCTQNIKPYRKITQLHMTWNKVSFHFQKRRLIKWGPLFQKINQNPCAIEGFYEDFGDHVLVTGRDSSRCKLGLSFSVSGFNCSFKCMWLHIQTSWATPPLVWVLPMALT